MFPQVKGDEEEDGTLELQKASTPGQRYEIGLLALFSSIAPAI